MSHFLYVSLKRMFIFIFGLITPYQSYTSSIKNFGVVFNASSVHFLDTLFFSSSKICACIYVGIYTHAWEQLLSEANIQHHILWCWSSKHLWTARCECRVPEAGRLKEQCELLTTGPFLQHKALLLFRAPKWLICVPSMSRITLLPLWVISTRKGVTICMICVIHSIHA